MPDYPRINHGLAQVFDTQTPTAHAIGLIDKHVYDVEKKREDRKAQRELDRYTVSSYVGKGEAKDKEQTAALIQEWTKAIEEAQDLDPTSEAYRKMMSEYEFKIKNATSYSEQWGQVVTDTVNTMSKDPNTNWRALQDDINDYWDNTPIHERDPKMIEKMASSHKYLNLQNVKGSVLDGVEMAIAQKNIETDDAIFDVTAKYRPGLTGQLSFDKLTQQFGADEQYLMDNAILESAKQAEPRLESFISEAIDNYEKNGLFPEWVDQPLEKEKYIFKQEILGEGPYAISQSSTNKIIREYKPPNWQIDDAAESAIIDQGIKSIKDGNTEKLKEILGVVSSDLGKDFKITRMGGGKIKVSWSIPQYMSFGGVKQYTGEKNDLKEEKILNLNDQDELKLWIANQRKTYKAAIAGGLTGDTLGEDVAEKGEFDDL